MSQEKEAFAITDAMVERYRRVVADLGARPTSPTVVRKGLEAVFALAEMEAVMEDWFTFDAARRWMDGTLAAPDEDAT